MPIYDDLEFGKFVRDLPAASETDLASGNNMPIVSPSDTKKMGGENVATSSSLGVFEKKGSITSPTYTLFKNTYSVGEKLFISFQCDHRVNLVAQVNGVSKILLNNVTSGILEYEVEDGFKSIGFFNYDNATVSYTLKVCAKLGAQVFRNEEHILALENLNKENGLRPLFGNILDGYEEPLVFKSLYCSALQSYLNPKGAGVYVVKENGLEFCRISLPAGVSISGSFQQLLLYEWVTNFDENGFAECYFSARVRNSDLPSSYVGLRILTNSGWSNPDVGLKNTSQEFSLVETHVTKTGTPGGVVKFQLKFFLNGTQSYTTTNDVTFDLFNVAMSDKPIRKNGSYQSYRSSTTSKVLLTLGDSITTESYYVGELRKLLEVSAYYNTAVVSATLCDSSSTTSYDGNPSTSIQSKNVLGNQVQKIINNIETYAANPPDVILIAIGTNDSIPADTENDYENVESYFSSDNGSSVVPCTTPTFDDADSYKIQRRHFAGALRYAVTKLQSLFPKAKIFVSTPIQSSIVVKNVKGIRVKQQLLHKIAERLGIEVVCTGEECGISQEFEYGGYFYDESQATSSLPRNGRDLRDGLHPNANGSTKMAKYIANRIKTAFSK